MRKIAVLLMSMLIVASFALAACANNAEIELYFTVKASIEAKLGEMVTVEDVTATDKSDSSKTYKAVATVKDKSGNEVSLTSGKFKADKLGDEAYIITYTVTANEKKFEKTTKVNVRDGAAPIISVENTDIMLIKGVEFDLASLNASAADNSGEAITLKYTVKVGETAQTVAGTKFTPSAKGDCSIYIDAEDSAGNKATQYEMSAKVIELDTEKQIINFSSLTAGDVQNGSIVDVQSFGKGVKAELTADTEKSVTVKGSGNFEIYQTATAVIYITESGEVTFGTNEGLASIELAAGWNIVSIQNLAAAVENLANISNVVFNLTSTKAATATICALVADEKATFKEFVVPEIEQANIGEDYVVVSRYALFTNGLKLTAEYEVKLGGVAVTVTNDRFKPTKGGVYEIIYTVSSPYLQEDLTATTEVTVSDIVNPEITLPYLSDVTFGNEYDLTSFISGIVMEDNSGVLPTLSYAVNFGTSEIIVTNKVFATTDKGEYTVTFTAMDATGNVSTATLKLTAMSGSDIDSAKSLYNNGTNLNVADFELNGGSGGLSLDTTKVLADMSEKSLKVALGSTGGKLAFKDLSLKFIDDNEYVLITIYSEGEITLKLWGRGTLTFELEKGWNALKVARKDYNAALYSNKGSIAGGQYQENNGANIGSYMDGKAGYLNFEFLGAESAFNVYLAGVYAVQGEFAKTDILDFSDITITNYSKSFSANRGFVAPTKSTDEKYQIFGSSVKFSNTKSYSAARSDAYFYIQKSAFVQENITGFNTVSYVFYYDKKGENNQVPVYFVSIGKKGVTKQYYELSEGVNILTFEKGSTFDQISSDGKIIASHDGGFPEYYYYLQTGRDYKVYDGANAYDVYLMGIYGV